MKKNLILAGEYYTHTPSKKQRIHNISMNTPVIKSIPVQDAYGTGKRGHASRALFAQSNPNTIFTDFDCNHHHKRLCPIRSLTVHAIQLQFLPQNKGYGVLTIQAAAY
jgi:hypothetical protein